MSVNPDEAAHKEPSHLDLHSLPFCSWIFQLHPFGCNGCVQMDIWMRLFQKLRVEMVSFVSWKYWLKKWTLKDLIKWFRKTLLDPGPGPHYLLLPFYLNIYLSLSFLSFWSGLFLPWIWICPLMQKEVSKKKKKSNKQIRSWWEGPFWAISPWSAQFVKDILGKAELKYIFIYI